MGRRLDSIFFFFNYYSYLFLFKDLFDFCLRHVCRLHALLWLSSILTRLLRNIVVDSAASHTMAYVTNDRSAFRRRIDHRSALRWSLPPESRHSDAGSWRSGGPRLGEQRSFLLFIPPPTPPPPAPPRQLSSWTPLVVQHRGQLPVSALKLPPAGRMFQLKAGHQ